MTDDSGRYSPVSSETSATTHNEGLDIDDEIRPTSRSKKRVQFHSEENLVRIREIPPRGETQTTDEEDSECSEDDDVDNEEEDSWPCETERSCTSTLPVIVNNAVKLDTAAKGSYDVSKTKGKGSHVVAQITGVTVSHTNKSKPKRHISRDRKPKKVAKHQQEKAETPKSKHKSGKKKSPKKADLEKCVSANKKVKDPKQTKPTQTNVKTAQVKPFGRCVSPVRKSTPRQESQSVDSASGPASISSHTDSKRVKDISVGKVYTMDRFIFPSDPTENLKHVYTLTESVDSGLSKSEISKTVQQRRKCFAWHMANGDQTHVLFGTPCILPLWESLNPQTHTAGTNGVETQL